MPIGSIFGGLFLNPNPLVSVKVDRKLMTLPVERSMNQTATAAIKSRPLLASFELKRTTPGIDDPLLR